MNKLSVCQKRAMRILANTPFRAHAIQYFKMFEILPVASIYPFRLACTYRSTIRKRNLDYVTLFNLEEHRYIYDTRTHDPWITRFSRTAYGSQSASFNITVLLNKLSTLDIDVITASTRSLFMYFLSEATGN